MGYKVLLSDGSTETHDDAVEMDQNGSGLRLLDANGKLVASYRDGEHRRCSKTTAIINQAPPPPSPSEE